MGKRSYSSTIHDLGTRWGWVVSFTPRPFYPREKSPRYPLETRLGGPQSRSGRCGEEKNLASAGNRTPAVQPVPILTELSRLLHTKEIEDNRKLFMLEFSTVMFVIWVSCYRRTEILLCCYLMPLYLCSASKKSCVRVNTAINASDSNSRGTRFKSRPDADYPKVFPLSEYRHMP
jgi:hypothetical protein